MVDELKLSHTAQFGTVLRGTTRKDGQMLNEVLHGLNFAWNEKLDSGSGAWQNRWSIGRPFNAVMARTLVEQCAAKWRTVTMGDVEPMAATHVELGPDTDQVEWSFNRFEHIEQKLGASQQALTTFCESALGLRYREDAERLTRVPLTDQASLEARLAIGTEVNVRIGTDESLYRVASVELGQVIFEHHSHTQPPGKLVSKIEINVGAPGAFTISGEDTFAAAGRRSNQFEIVTEGLAGIDLEKLEELKQSLRTWEVHLGRAITQRDYRPWGDEHFAQGDIVSRTGATTFHRGTLLERSIFTNGLVPTAQQAGKRSKRVPTTWPYWSVATRSRLDPKTGELQTIHSAPTIAKRCGAIVNKLRRLNGLPVVDLNKSPKPAIAVENASEPPPLESQAPAASPTAPAAPKVQTEAKVTFISVGSAPATREVAAALAQQVRDTYGIAVNETAVAGNQKPAPADAAPEQTADRSEPQPSKSASATPAPATPPPAPASESPTEPAAGKRKRTPTPTTVVKGPHRARGGSLTWSLEAPDGATMTVHWPLGKEHLLVVDPAGQREPLPGSQYIVTEGTRSAAVAAVKQLARDLSANEPALSGLAVERTSTERAAPSAPQFGLL